MKILIVTQVLDRTHPILGFFHRWVEEFSYQCESVEIIALQVGEYNLPHNVQVHSLGKEEGVGRFGYLIRFYRYIWCLRHRYDVVFVHMNQIYVILGALFWRMVSKKIGLWYAHGTITLPLRIATILTNFIFTSTEHGFRINTQKRIIVGQGIDGSYFNTEGRNLSHTTPLQLVTVGRISETKGIMTMLRACTQLRTQNIPFHFSIVGIPITQQEKEYLTSMQAYISNEALEQFVTYSGPATQADVPHALRSAHVFIHDGATMSLDKALLEAVACGCVVVSSNKAYRELALPYTPQYLYSTKDSAALAQILTTIAACSIDVQQMSMQLLRNEMVSKHGIVRLVSDIVSRYDSCIYNKK